MVRATPSRWATSIAAVGLLVVVVSVTGCTTSGGAGTEASGPATAANITPAAGKTSAGVAPRVGFQAPDFALPDLDGKTVRLSDFRGRPVFINFWTTWCTACKEEMPLIQASFNDHKAQGHDPVFLGMDVEEDAQTVRQFVQAGGYNWTMVLDTDADIFVNKYKGSAFPTSYFIDKEGIIRSVRIGGMTRQILEGRLNLINTW